jgi:6-phosphogluconolactonase
MLNLHNYTDREHAASELSKIILSELAQGLEQAEHVTLALPGGDTPSLLYNNLSQSPFNWESVSLITTDERCVPMDHDRSNFKNMFSNMKGRKIPDASFVYLDTSLTNPELLNFYNSNCQNLVSCTFGMGLDGHFASIFPESDLLLSDQMPTIMHADAPDGLESRVSLTKEAFCQVNSVHLLIHGSEKLSLLEHIESDAKYSQMPISWMINQSGKDIEVHYAH